MQCKGIRSPYFPLVQLEIDKSQERHNYLGALRGQGARVLLTGIYKRKPLTRAAVLAVRRAVV